MEAVRESLTISFDAAKSSIAPRIISSHDLYGVLAPFKINEKVSSPYLGLLT